MDIYRSSQSQDYGILRKKDGKEEELFVFGYSCKVYEDYDKSLYIDQGKHLIPWLGDDTLKIDRFVLHYFILMFLLNVRIFRNIFFSPLSDMIVAELSAI